MVSRPGTTSGARSAFSTFQGTLKSIRPNSLSPEAAAALEFACPAFLDALWAGPENAGAKEARQAALSIAHGMGFETSEVNEEPKRRRFAGDGTLARSCYFAVARDDSGNDGGALANELMAYRVPERTGYSWIWDLRDAAIARDLGLTPRSSLGLRVDEVTLLQKRNPDIDFGDTNGRALIFELPYDCRQTFIEQVIDLRLNTTRDWFFERFRTGDGEVFSKPRGTNVSSFVEMLPALMHVDLGGGHETRGIGTWMRQSGVSALIFPSARCNVGVRLRAGKLMESYGWNLVDYRSTAMRPFSDRVVDVSPWLAEVFQGIQFQVPHPDSEFRGSFAVAGNEEFHRDLFKARLRRFASQNPLKTA